MYFADFFCAGGRTKTHYVTIVLARAGSPVDQSHVANLVPLQRNNNPFLCQRSVQHSDKNGKALIEIQWNVSSKIWIEVMYPENGLLQHCSIEESPIKKECPRYPQVKTLPCGIRNLSGDQGAK